MAPPPPLIVRNTPVAYKQQVATILLFAALFAIIPLFHPGALLALIAAMLGWQRWRRA